MDNRFVHTYLAVFTRKTDGKIEAFFPDLADYVDKRPMVSRKKYSEALSEAESLLGETLIDLENNKVMLPEHNFRGTAEKGSEVRSITVDTLAYRKEHYFKSKRINLTIPEWAYNFIKGRRYNVSELCKDSIIEKFNSDF